MRLKLLTFYLLAHRRSLALARERLAAIDRRLSVCTLHGFTIVELMITLSIFLLISSVVLVKYRTFDNSARFANASEDVVFAFRQAQVYGAGAKGSGGAFSTSYGVYFDTSTSNQMKLFADKNADGVYNSGDLDIDTIIWDGGVSIKTNGLLCGLSSVSTIAISFNRPKIDAIIRGPAGTCSDGTIILTNGNKESLVVINNAGQISVQ